MQNSNGDAIEKILNSLGLEYTNNGQGYAMPCPIHQGDNPVGLSIRAKDGFWTCWTHGCHKGHRRNLVGFIEASQGLSWGEATELVRSVAGEHFLFTPAASTEKTRFIKDMTIPEAPVLQKMVTKQEVMSRFNLGEANYFTREKGITLDTLREFGVFACDNPGKFFHNRVVIPLYDRAGEWVIGCSGRTIYERCPNCEKHHAPQYECENAIVCCKWKHSKDLRHTLYNLWNYRDEESVILVEGPVDCWKFHQAGIKNVMAVLGAALTAEQRLILEGLPIFRVLIAMDGDIPGQKASNAISGQLARLYNTEILDMPKGGPSSLSIQELQECLNTRQ